MSAILVETQDICAYGTHRLGEISDLICYRTLNFILEVTLNYAAQPSFSVTRRSKKLALTSSCTQVMIFYFVHHYQRSNM